MSSETDSVATETQEAKIQTPKITGRTVPMEPDARTALEEKVQAALDGEVVTKKDEGTAETEDTTETTDTSQESETTDEGTTQVNEEAEATEAAVEGEQQDVVTDATPTLPDAHRRSLIAYGWTDDAIDANLKSLGAQFIDTADRIHTNRAQETASWAAKGRELRGQNPQTPALIQPTAQSPTPAKLAAVDVEALTEQYGDEELVKKIAGPVNEAVAQINEILPQLQAGQQAAQDAQVDALDRQCQTFFSSPEITAYKEVYGTNESLTQEQFDARLAVIDEAEAIMLGSQFVGRPKTFAESLEVAHDNVASTFHASKAQEIVRKQAMDRARAVTPKPSARKAPASVPTTTQGKREALEDKVTKGLKKAFN